MGGKGRTRFVDSSMAASDPGGIRISHARLRSLRPDLYRVRGVLLRWPELFGTPSPLVRLAEHLRYGDSRVAVVMSVEPLLVAAYTDELDCAVLLRFPRGLAEEFRLREGSRLLTVNLYGRGAASDLIPGAGDTGRYTNLHAVIVEFVSDDADRIERRKAQIDRSEWPLALDLGRQYVRRHPGLARDG